MGSQDWRTPPSVFKALHEEFRFNVDAAASNENALLKGLGDCYCDAGDWHDETGDDEGSYFVGRFYTAETDGANPEHYVPEDRVFCNPPYAASIVKRFVECAVTTSKRGTLWVLLLNATTTDTRWFHKYIWDCRLHRPREGVELRFVKGRIAFHGVQNTPIPSPRYSNMIVVFHPAEASS